MENKKIYGNVVGVPNPKPDWYQTDKTKADYVNGSEEYRTEVDSKFANALKGSENGVAVRADVSPIEHSMGVKLVSDTVTDFSNVTLKKLGKNLIDYKSCFKSKKHGTDEQLRYVIDLPDYIPYGSTITISYDIIDEMPTYFYFYSDDEKAPKRTVSVSTGEISDTVHFTGSSDIVVEKLTVTLRKGCSYRILWGKATPSYEAFTEWLDKFKYIQVELGENATEYEEYVEPITHTVNADGTVDGVKSLYPTTTLCTDTDGVQINCEYNKDINKAFAELQNAIISLGGNI